MASRTLSPERFDVLEYLPGIEEIDPVPTPPWKRTMDVVGATVGLILLSPIFVMISLAIALDSRGGPIYRQARVGRNGRVFTCWKFRSMRSGSDKELAALMSRNDAEGFIFKMTDDPRRTRVGKILRRTSLDELPQLVNVLRGEMCLVGPRPPTVAEVLRYDRRHLRRLSAQPGMTGLWQVTLRRVRHDFADMVELDTRYARELSLKMDIEILLKTIPTVLGGKGAH